MAGGILYKPGGICFTAGGRTFSPTSPSTCPVCGGFYEARLCSDNSLANLWLPASSFTGTPFTGFPAFAVRDADSLDYYFLAADAGAGGTDFGTLVTGTGCPCSCEDFDGDLFPAFDTSYLVTLPAGSASTPAGALDCNGALVTPDGSATSYSWPSLTTIVTYVGGCTWQSSDPWIITNDLTGVPCDSGGGPTCPLIILTYAPAACGPMTGVCTWWIEAPNDFGILSNAIWQSSETGTDPTIATYPFCDSELCPFVNGTSSFGVGAVS